MIYKLEDFEVKLREIKLGLEYGTILVDGNEAICCAVNIFRPFSMFRSTSSNKELTLAPQLLAKKIMDKLITQSKPVRNLFASRKGSYIMWL